MFISRGPSLLDYLDSLPPISRALEAPVRLPIADRYKVNLLYFICYMSECHLRDLLLKNSGLFREINIKDSRSSWSQLYY